MKRENRYIVIKRSDVACGLNPRDTALLCALVGRVELDRAQRGKAPLECVVVESDWPEYEPTWKAIEARVDGMQPTSLEPEEITVPDDAETFEAWVQCSEVDGIAYDGSSFEAGYRRGKVDAAEAA